MGAVLGTLFGTSPIQTQQLQNIQQAQQSQQNAFNGTGENYVNATNQSQNSIAQQQALANALAGQGGIQNQANVYNQQQALAGQLGQMAQGQGPNPALAQLAQSTGQNTANQAALMAGQRGAGANAGLIARQAAQQGAANQQQAVGQAATLQAQQQLGAIGALQQQQSNLANLATQQVGQQAGAINNLNQQNLAQQSQAANQQNIAAQQQQMAANIAAQQNQQQTALANAQTQQNNQQTQMVGNLIGGAAGVASSFLAEGGEIPKYADGGMSSFQQGQGIGNTLKKLFGGSSNSSSQPTGSISGSPSLGVLPSSTQTGNIFGVSNGNNLMANMYAAGGPVFANSSNQGSSLKANYLGKSKIGKHLFAHGGKPSHMVDALLSPGEKVLPPNKASEAKDGKVNPMKAGKTVPGKAAVGGAINSYSNDTVPAKLKPGSIVLPRSVTQSSNPDEKAKKFVAALKSKKGK